jgi:hypothetical protein
MQLDMSDEITHDTLMTNEGQLVQPRMRDLLGLEPLSSGSEQESSEPESSKEETS